MGLTTVMGDTYQNNISENQGLKTNLTIFNATVQLGPVSNMGPVSPIRFSVEFSHNNLKEIKVQFIENVSLLLTSEITRRCPGILFIILSFILFLLFIIRRRFNFQFYLDLFEQRQRTSLLQYIFSLRKYIYLIEIIFLEKCKIYLFKIDLGSIGGIP